MQRLEVSGAVRPICGSLGVKRLICYDQRLQANMKATRSSALSEKLPTNQVSLVSLLALLCPLLVAVVTTSSIESKMWNPTLSTPISYSTHSSPHTDACKRTLVHVFHISRSTCLKFVVISPTASSAKISVAKAVLLQRA